MNMLEPQWKQERPDFVARQKLWEKAVFEADTLSSPIVDELLRELGNTHVNGGALFGRFCFLDDPVIHWFISRNRFDELDFFEHFLTSDAVREVLPSLKAPASLNSIKWEWWSPYLLGGDLARTLMFGGAYRKYEKGGRSAKDLGEGVCSDLFGDRFEDVRVLRTGDAWSGWFRKIAWDMTWVGVDKRDLKIWVLCLTDTD
jgi:hypothetical protein